MIHATDKTSAIHQSTIWGLHHHARHRFVQAVLHFQCRKYQRDTDQLVPHGSYSKNSSLVPRHRNDIQKFSRERHGSPHVQSLPVAVKQGRKPELTIFTSKKRTFPQAFSVRKSVVQAVEKFLQKEKLYVKRDTNVPFSARPEKKALRTAKVHSYPRSILKAQFSMS